MMISNFVGWEGLSERRCSLLGKQLLIVKSIFLIERGKNDGVNSCKRGVEFLSERDFIF
jgi:hypothetical protein